MGRRLSSARDAVRSWYSAAVLPRWGALRARAAAGRVRQRWAAMSARQHRVIGAAGALSLALVLVAGTLLFLQPGGGQGPARATASPTTGVAVASPSPTASLPSYPASPTWTPWVPSSPEPNDTTAPPATPVQVANAEWPDAGSPSFRQATVLATLDCPNPSSAPAVSDGRLYIFCASEEVRAFDLATNALIETYKLKFPNWDDYFQGECSMACIGPDLSGTLAVDHGLWVGWAAGGVQRLDLTTKKVTVNRADWVWLGYGLGYVWVTDLVDPAQPTDDPSSDEMYGVKPSNGSVAVTANGRYAAYDRWISIACGAVWQIESYDSQSVVSLNYPTKITEDVWAARSDGALAGVQQIGKDCWAESRGSSWDVTRLGRLAPDKATTDGYDLWSPDLPGDVEILDGKPYLVRWTDAFTTVQLIDMETFGPSGDLWRTISGPIFWAAGGSLWSTGDVQGHSVLFRLALSDTPRATATPAASASPTPAESAE